MIFYLNALQIFQQWSPKIMKELLKNLIIKKIYKDKICKRIKEESSPNN